MSNIERFESMKQLVRMVETDFNKLAQIHGAVNFEREASFALQILQEKQFLATAAMSDPDSLKRAVLNVAAVGLTLSPFHKEAYLIPRGKSICFDPSYMGLIKLAVDVGSIKYAKAEVVREKDEFQLRGLGNEPVHNFTPFGDRGQVIGAYCVAKTHDGDYLTTTMTADEILAVRNRSEAAKKNAGPWVEFENEMIKKTVIKRAYKMWPKTDTRAYERMAKVIELSNDVEPLDFAAPPMIEGDKRAESLTLLRDKLAITKRTEEKFISHLNRTTGRKIERLEDLTDIEITQADVFLTSIIANDKAKEAKVENAG